MSKGSVWIFVRAGPRLSCKGDAVTYARGVATMFHVSSVRNRGSIRSHGLDVSKMGAARGIAGSRRPEAEGIFLCQDESTADWFVRINNTGGPVDLWQVDGVEADQLLDNGSGFFYLPGRIPVDRITLVQQDITDRTSWSGSVSYPS